ncbi:hypothetical protein Aca07nite_23380 [Actinoplanes capillaceus]|uniref:Uncharacterized protein n=1 Tax=Actinoplanes campanulatus TaxID=113559 RepID=A0ABQ3WGK2_9ACTN|nr:hypothetical protein Aca07nite_23380 [Actinoplanes capillaceus]
MGQSASGVSTEHRHDQPYEIYGHGFEGEGRIGPVADRMLALQAGGGEGGTGWILRGGDAVPGRV